MNGAHRAAEFRGRRVLKRGHAFLFRSRGRGHGYRISPKCFSRASDRVERQYADVLEIGLSAQSAPGISRHSRAPEPDLFRRVREETERMPNSQMQIAAEQFQFMGLLVRAIGVRRALEIGVFTGSSSLAVALALPKGER